MKKLLLILFILCVQFSNAQVGIGTSDPNQSAQLEVLSSEKGLLIPRIQLSSTTDASTIKNGNVESLLIYNTVNTADVTKGFYYWGGIKWRKIVTEAIVNNLISEDNTLAEGKVFLGNASGVGAEVSISGDATIANTGALTIANDAVTTVKIFDGAITKTKLIATTTGSDNGKVLAINSDGSALEWKVTSAGVVLYTEDFVEDNSTPKEHSLTKAVLGATVNNFKVSLNGSVVSSSNITYNSASGANGSIKITGIPVFIYDIVTVVYATN
jgi:hypothetical protein